MRNNAQAISTTDRGNLRRRGALRWVPRSTKLDLRSASGQGRWFWKDQSAWKLRGEPSGAPGRRHWVPEDRERPRARGLYKWTPRAGLWSGWGRQTARRQGHGPIALQRAQHEEMGTAYLRGGGARGAVTGFVRVTDIAFKAQA